MAEDPTEPPDDAVDGEGEAEEPEEPEESTNTDAPPDSSEPDEPEAPLDSEPDDESGDESGDLAEPEPDPAESDTDRPDEGGESTRPSADIVARDLSPADLSDEEAATPGLPIRDRLAKTLRDQGPVEAGAELTSTFFGPLREFALPLAAIVIMLVLVITFRAVLLPFILAVALVYLMEPIVGFIGRRPGKESGLPRWVAVILVYLSFIAVLTTSLLVVAPPFVSEIVRFAEEVPEFVQEFRKERLPGLNREVQDFLRNYLPIREEAEDATLQTDRAAAAIISARKVAAARATAYGNARLRVAWATDIEGHWEATAEGDGATGGFVFRPPVRPLPRMTLDDALVSSGWVYQAEEKPSGLVVRPGDGGELHVDLKSVAIEIEEVGDRSWVVRQKDDDAVPVEKGVAIDDMFNLERRLDEVIEGLVSTSNERLGDVIEFAQRLVVGIVGAFVGIILTFMVAAFMSIDLPRVMGFMRSLVPRKARGGYDILLEQLDTGLAGVVRGQLLICLVNGVLTYIGLWFLDVKFSVLLAVVAGILSLIPVFGTVLSTVPIVLIALTDGFATGLGALLWILAIHGLEANVLNPKIIGTSAHIHPVIVIFALLAGESAYGLVGALLAVPTASILLTLFNFVRTRAWTGAEARERST